KRLVDPFEIGSGKPEIAGGGVVGGMFGTRRLGDGENRITPRQEGERHLPRRRAMRFGDFLQFPAPRRGWSRKVPVAEWAVGDDGDIVARAPGNDGVLDGALLKVVEYLVAGDL